MANIAAALNSLASTTMFDLALPLFGDKLAGEQVRLRASRFATLGWGVVLMAIAVAARNWGSVLEAGLAIASVPLGALLGVFTLGVLTVKVTENGAIAGMLAGMAVILYVTFETPIAWTWYVVIGSVTTFFVGWLTSFLPSGGRAPSSTQAP